MDSSDINYKPLVMIVLVNWNGCADTIRCMRSLDKLSYGNFFTVVCDNNSEDGSLAAFRQWAADHGIFYHQTEPDALEGSIEKPPPARSLVCIPSTSNRGFAGGNNLAVKYGEAIPELRYIWLLNNDTEPHPEALTALVEKAVTNSAIGLCGSTLLQMGDPQTVQCLGGGGFDPWTGRTWHIGEGLLWERVKKDVCLEADVEAKMGYVYGASMLVSRQFIREVGLMSEDYFLYFEELDWVKRASDRFQMAYASRSLVRHKEGGSTVFAGLGRSERADYYLVRNRILIVLRYYPAFFLFALGGLIVSLARRIVRRQPDRVPLLLRAARDGVRAAWR